jgi:hypothetical protein
MGRAFVPRALTLQQSIVRRSPNSHFAFYCMDNATAALLKTFDLQNARILIPDEFETPAFREVKHRLNPGEYCWTCKSIALLHQLTTDPGLDWAVWVDADMYAFDDPNKALETYADANVLLTPHRFSFQDVAVLEPIVGRFNAGYVAARNTKVGRAALDWWLARCIESCSATPTDGNYADQKYLERMPSLFSGVAESSLAGLNCAPWNVIGKSIEAHGDRVAVASSPLLIYHFQGLRVLRQWAFDLYPSKDVALPASLKQHVYRPYLTALIEQMQNVARRPNKPPSGVDNDFLGLRGWYVGAKQFARSLNATVQFS